MKIKSLKNCFTTNPVERRWVSGKVVEIEDEIANILLRNANFVKASAETKLEKDVRSKHRKERSSGSRN